MAENQETVGGRYRILGRLGKGAMGVVFMAYDPVLDRKVAIKQMGAEIARNEDLRQRFYVEARAAARLNHPHIITVHELQESGGEIYMVMEMLEGQPVASLVEGRTTPLPMETTLDIMAQVCDGLEYAHEHAIVHRDIKPANLFVTSSGVVKILDFGIARLGSLHMTATGAMVGTPDYMSPEQIRGDEVDRRTDVWAAGAVLYQLLSGSKPFEGRPLAKLLMAITHTPHVPLQQRSPALPRSVCDLVDRMLSKPRDQRPATAGLVRDELRAILGRESVRRPQVDVAEAYEQTLVIVPGTRAGTTAAAAAPVPPAPAAPAPPAAPATAIERPQAAAAASTAPPPLPPPLVAPPAAPPEPRSAPPPGARPAAVAPPAPASVAVVAPATAAAAGQPGTPGTGSSRKGVLALVVLALVVAGGGLAGWWWLGPRMLQPPAATPTNPAGGEPAAAASAGPASSTTPATAPLSLEQAVAQSAGGAGGGQTPSAPQGTAPGDSGQGSPPPAADAAQRQDHAAAAGEVRPPTTVSAPSPGPASAARNDTTPASPVARPSTPAAGAERKAEAGGEEAAKPSRPAGEPTVTRRQRVTEELTDDTLSTLSGRSQSSYGGTQAGATVAAVNRINWVLEQYAGALQRGDADTLRRHRPSPSAAESQLLAARGVSVKLEDVSVQVDGTQATARARRTVEATLATGAPLREHGTVTFSLERRPTGWVITGIR